MLDLCKDFDGICDDGNFSVPDHFQVKYSPLIPISVFPVVS